MLRLTEAGEVVEEVGNVGGDVLVGGEQAEVLVDAGGDGVVVPGPDVRVAAEAVRVTAHDERRLRVELAPGDAVDDVDTRLFELM